MKSLRWVITYKAMIAGILVPFTCKQITLKRFVYFTPGAEQMDKKRLIEEIAKRHHIILDELDPIFAVVTANEILFDDFLFKLDKALIKHKLDLESSKVAILKEMNAYSKETQEALRVLMRHESNMISSTPMPTSKKEDQTASTSFKKIIMWSILGQVVFLLIGIIIGTFI